MTKGQRPRGPADAGAGRGPDGEDGVASWHDPTEVTRRRGRRGLWAAGEQAGVGGGRSKQVAEERCHSALVAGSAHEGEKGRLGRDRPGGGRRQEDWSRAKEGRKERRGLVELGQGELGWPKQEMGLSPRKRDKFKKKAQFRKGEYKFEF